MRLIHRFGSARLSVALCLLTAICFTACPDTKWNECFYSDSFHYPQFTPDGELIVFLLPPEYFGCDEGGNRIYSIDLLDNNAVELLLRCADYGWNTPPFTPDGAELLIDDANSLFFFDLEDRNMRLIAEGPGIHLQSPALSPDGEKILFVAMLEEGGTLQLFIMNSDGSGQIMIADSVDSEAKPFFTPDGNQIVYVGSDYVYHRGGYGGDVYVMNTDGSNKTRLTNTYEMEIDPKISPDGEKLLFITDSTRRQAFVMDIGSGSKVELSDREQDVNQAEFSPDGASILCTNDYGFVFFDTSGAMFSEIAIMDLAPSCPHFSPNGEQIVFAHPSDTENSGIWMMNTDGSELTNLTEGFTPE